MKMVRDALGDDAVIMATNTDKTKGIVTVTAAIDTDILPEVSKQPSPPLTTTFTPKTSLSFTKEDTMIAVDVIAQTLEAHGCPRRLANKILRQVDDGEYDTPEQALSEALNAIFTFKSALEDKRTPILLLGAPAAGKTVTTAKLAANTVLAGEKVAVITSDVVKAGGVEQLQLLTKILKISLHAVEDGESFKTAMNHIPHDARVIIDTGGINPFIKNEISALQDIIQAEFLQKVLVLPAGTDTMEAQELAAAYAATLKPTLLLVTRLDLAYRLGAILVAADVGNLSIGEIGISDNIAKGLKRLTPDLLAKLLLMDARKPKINLFA
jgi:flagellar biosynthesis protein FlhF